MIHTQETPNETPTNHQGIHEWINFPIAKIKHGIFSHGTTALLCHHFIVFAHDINDDHSSSYTNILAVDLRDNTIQKDELDRDDQYFVQVKEYSLNKYGKNQLIKFGGESHRGPSNELVLITIDSFDPLTVLCEEIKAENAPKLSRHTAQMYQDFLYVFGGRKASRRKRSLDILNQEEKKKASNELWCFDLEKRTWKLCETNGEAPEPLEGAKSFLVDDYLYIYGGDSSKDKKANANYSELFELNLKSMKWRKIEQHRPQPGQEDSAFFDRFGLNVYGNSMLVIKNEKNLGYDRLYSCSRHTLSSWARIDVRGLGGIRTIGNPVIYKDVLYTYATENGKRNELFLAALDLGSVGLPPSRSAEEEYWSSLFMSENESDVQLKVQGKIIPAHKKVLVHKCKFLANLFNSGMMESTSGVIDINDCEYETFKEFLRFLYCGMIQVNFPQSIKLLFLADRYIEKELHEKCVNILVQNLTPKNVYKVLDFAREREIPVLKDWCIKLFQHQMTFEHIIPFIKYLQSPKNQPYEKENRPAIEKAVSLVLENIQVISNQVEPKEPWSFFEHFLIKNISIQNIVQWSNSRFILFSDKMASLKEVLMNFVYNYFQTLEEQGLFQEMNSNFRVYFSVYQKEQEEKSIKEPPNDANHTENKDESQGKSLKRIDPTNNSNEGEKDISPILKKAK